MLATNYTGGFNHAAAAAANFSNQAHNYNISANTTPVASGNPVGDIPFMYFTPRDAIKFKKNKQYKASNNMSIILQQQ